MPSQLADAARHYVAASAILVMLALYYLANVALIRWRPRPRRIEVTRYDPPNISPALAAYLREGGRAERACGAALVSLAAKGFLSIREHEDWFMLERLRDTDSSLPSEEAALFAEIFPRDARECRFNSADPDRLLSAYRQFRASVEAQADDELISPHKEILWMGRLMSVVAWILVSNSFPSFEEHAPLGSYLFLSLWIVLGIYCWTAALRAWPRALRKLVTYFPGVRLPVLPLVASDLAPLYLTAAAVLGFAFLAFLTSPAVSLFTLGLVTVNGVFAHFLDAPTRRGRALLDELHAFRAFLLRTDADRFNRMNRPAHTPAGLDQSSAYCVALAVEHAWGEEFTTMLIDILAIESGYHFPTAIFANPVLGDPSDRPIELNIKSRK
jgi:hypothetical protein